MRFTFILRLMIAITFVAPLTPTQIEANFFDSLKKFGKKAASAVKKAAHGPIGKMALAAGGAAVASKYGKEAGDMFQGAAQSLHLADEAETAAEESDDNAAQAEDDGNMDTAAEERTAAKKHRATAASHRANHAANKKAYEDVSGRNFDDDHEEYVGKRIRKAVAEQDEDGDEGITDDEDYQEHDADENNEYDEEEDEGYEDEGITDDDDEYDDEDDE